MRTIIAPIPSEVIGKQLLHCRFLKLSSRGNFEIYLFRHRTVSPLLLEIGRLREWSFRCSGSGTGKSYDLDQYDSGAFACQQLILWDPINKTIAGGYRLQHCTDAYDGHSACFLPSFELFEFSPAFTRDYLPYTVELGRSWIHPHYQTRSSNPRSIFVLESLWEGIGEAIRFVPETKYLFGKVSIPKSYPLHARDLIIGMLQHYFGNKCDLIRARHPLSIFPQMHLFYEGLTFERGFAELRNTLKFHGFSIPPLISSYIKLGPDILTFDSTINREFGAVTDTALLVEIDKIVSDRRERYFSAMKPVTRVA